MTKTEQIIKETIEWDTKLLDSHGLLAHKLAKALQVSTTALDDIEQRLIELGFQGKLDMPSIVKKAKQEIESIMSGDSQL